jgi:predicted small lipoprotein YifL
MNTRVFFLLIMLVGLSGCGKKSSVKSPEDVPETYPRSYPYVPTSKD